MGSQALKEGKKSQLKLSTKHTNNEQAEEKAQQHKTVVWMDGAVGRRRVQVSPKQTESPPPPQSVSCTMKYRSVSPTQLQVPQGYLGTQKAFSKCWLSEQIKKLKKKCICLHLMSTSY